MNRRIHEDDEHTEGGMSRLEGPVCRGQRIEIRAKLQRSRCHAICENDLSEGLWMILRLSEKLNTKIKAGKLNAMPLDDNPYSDWSCHLFTADRTQYIILSNTKSLYSYVMYGKGITNDSRLIERALSTIRDFMEDDGQAFAYKRFIAATSLSVIPAASGAAYVRNRSGGSG